MANGKKDQETGELNWKLFVCSKEGTTNETWDKIKSLVARGERKRGRTRCGCKAKMTIVKSRGRRVWVVSKFIEGHNHVLTTPRKHLAGHELSEVLSGPDPDPDPNKHKLVHKNSICLSRKDKTKVQKIDSSEAETTEDENIATGSARNSFSQAIKECQDRRLRSNALSRKSDRRRPASLDLNSPLSNPISSSSPRFGIMNKQSSITRKTTPTFPSPGTPNYRQPNIGIQKGWSSERVATHANANRRNLNGPLHNGRTLPSKWEDAERWIFSPVLGDSGVLRTPSIQQTQRRPKSKSGPLGPPGVAYYQMFSPAGPMFERGGHNDNLIGNLPYSSGMMKNPDALTVGYGGCQGGNGSFVMGTEPCMARSISIHGCSEMKSQSLVPVHQDKKYEHGANDISRAVSRRDMATQMSPESRSIQSSLPRHSSSFSLTTSSGMQTVVEPRNMHSNKTEIRDVPVDERVTMTRWSKKNRGNKNSVKGNQNGDDWRRKAVNFQSGGWQVMAETSKSVSKIQREEAKITAWENLQKAKAEASMRKLEMKLEKKRSSSMDKIMNKLRSAQKKAQQMRSSVMTNPASHQITRPSDRALSFRRTRPIGSLSGCFTCHVF